MEEHEPFRRLRITRATAEAHHIARERGYPTAAAFALVAGAIGAAILALLGQPWVLVLLAAFAGAVLSYPVIWGLTWGLAFLRAPAALYAALEAEFAQYLPEPEARAGLPGWVGRVVSEVPGGVMLTLHPPNDEVLRAQCQVVRVEDGKRFHSAMVQVVDSGGGVTSFSHDTDPGFPGTLDHYSVTFPSMFSDCAPTVRSSVYEVRWVLWRTVGPTLLADVYTFELWNGGLRRAAD